MDLTENKSVSTDKSKFLSTLLVATTLSASAIEPVVVKAGIGPHATAFQLLILKSLFGLLFMSPVFFKMRVLKRSELIRVLLLSFLFLMTYVFMYTAIAQTSVILVATLVTVTPAIVAIINIYRGTVETTPRFWLALIAAILGVVLTLGGFSADVNSFAELGTLLALGAALTSALYRTQVDVVAKTVPPLVISGYLFLTNGIAAAFCLPWLGDVTSVTIGQSAWLGLAAAAANITFVKALQMIGSTRLSVISLLQRPLVIVVAAVFLKETLGLTQALGIVLVLAGIQYAKPKPRSAPIVSKALQT